MEKFKNIPQDRDTKVISTTISSVLGLDCLIETWTWDGFDGCSYIFEICDINVSIEELSDVISKQHNGAQIESKAVSSYQFFNFSTEN